MNLKRDESEEGTFQKIPSPMAMLAAGRGTHLLTREQCFALDGVNRAAMARRAAELLARTRQLTPSVTQEVHTLRARASLPTPAGLSLCMPTHLGRMPMKGVIA